MASVTAADSVAVRPGSAFELHLDNFDGPFDLLLSLIAKHKLDVTEIALASVTDEFIAHLQGLDEWDLDQASEFLVVAATLLDLKAARLLPATDVEDVEDLALLEARDLLFVRLLQYRAYKQVSALLGERFERNGLRSPRAAGLDPHLGVLLPDLVLGLSLDEFARVAAAAMAPRPGPPQVGLTHLHAPVVSVAEQAELIATRLRRRGTLTFRALIADTEAVMIVVGRFLALLELFRVGQVAFDQAQPLDELTIRWCGGAGSVPPIDSSFDEPTAAPDPPVEPGQPPSRRSSVQPSAGRP